VKRLSSPIVLILAAASLALVHAPRAYALALTVNSPNDGTDANPGDGTCETAPGNGVCTLRAAVMEGNKASIIANVTLPGSTQPYLLTIPGPNEDSSATGDLDIRWNVNIFGPTTGGNPAVIKAGSGFNDRIVDVPNAAGQSIAVKNVTIQGGAAPSGQDGGGVRDLGATSLILNADLITLNSAGGGNGGGVSISSGSGTTTELFNTTVTANSASGNGGGVDLEGGVSATYHQATMSNNTSGNGGGMSAFVSSGATGSFALLIGLTVSGNTATGAGGGLDLSRAPLAQNLEVNGNTASLGGGVQLVGGSVKSSLVNGDIDSNTATTSGGGLYTTQCGASCGSVLEVTFDGNGAAKEGSGAYVNDGLTFAYDTLSNNTITGLGVLGGAIYHAGGASNPLVLTDDTLSANKGVSLLPASALAFNSAATDRVTNLTIDIPQGNGATFGIARGATAAPPKLKNTIISNSGTGITNCQTGAIATLGHNLDDGTTCGLNTSLGDLIGTDPQLGPLSDYGGPTSTMRIISPSPALNAGDNNGCPSLDQRSVRRPQTGGGTSKRCDMGAYENSASLANSDLQLTVTPTPSNPSPGATVTYAITVTNIGLQPSTNSALQMTFPSTMSVVGGSCSASNGGVCGGSGSKPSIKWSSISNVGSGVTASIQAQVLPTTPAGTVIAVPMSIFGDNPEHEQIDNQASPTVTVGTARALPRKEEAA